MTTPTAVAMLGLPGTGKTTFLAALYHSLADPKDGASAALRRIPTNRAYLESIRGDWIAGRPVGRTSVGTGEIVELEIELDGVEIDISIPDVSGESFLNALLDRSIDSALADAVQSASGLLLFSHPAELRPRILISEVLKLGLRKARAEGIQRDEELKPFSPRDIPAEAQLVDLLQCALDLRGVPTEPLRTSLIVSAWDEMPGSMTPTSWLSQMPMLSQYLRNSFELLSSEIFGVSAQGGSYETSDPATGDPSERPYVVRADGTVCSDFSDPIRWAALR